MRRPGTWTAVSVGLVASLVLALLVGSSMLPATGRPANPKANRFAPSGVVSADPDAAAAAAAAATAQAAADAAGGGSVPAPSVSGTSGCNDVDGRNVRRIHGRNFRRVRSAVISMSVTCWLGSPPETRS